MHVTPRQTPAATGNDAGFTLLEAMVALALVALIVISYLGIRTNALADGIEARNWRLARELAEEKMSELSAGARETPPQSGVSEDFEKYPGFSFQIVIGESSIGEIESSVASAAAGGDDQDAADRTEWQQNRDLYRKASARGQGYLEYQDETRLEEERRRQEQVPSETEFEDVAVFVFFPKVNAEFEGQKESFSIKAKVSTLALSGMTPQAAQMAAEAKGQTTGAAGEAPAGATAGGGKQ